MTLRMHKGYWTIFSGAQPIMSCVSFDVAWKLMYQLAKEMRLGTH